MRDLNGNERRTAVLHDPYPVVLDAVEGVVESAGVEVVGKATSSAEALELAEQEEPDVLVTEISLAEEGDGLECVREARRRVSELKPIVFSLSDDPNDIEAAFAAGAVAYVVKTAQPDDLAVAIRQAFDPSVYLLPTDGVSVSPNGNGQAVEADEEDSGGLTPREREILRLVAEGNSNAQVARMLWVTEQTVKFHLSNVYRKLGVANRTEASRWAQLHGLLNDA